MSTSLCPRNPALASLSANDRKRFCEFSAGASISPTHPTIISAIHDAMIKYPHSVAAHTVQHNGSIHPTEQITYVILQKRANLVSAALKAHGVASGDSVCIFLSRGLDMLVAIVAILQLGASYVPQDARIAPDAQLVRVAAAARAPVILTTHMHASGLPQFSETVVLTERFIADPFLGGQARMYRTGDLGRWTVDGELEHFGRVDEQVKVKGFRVELDGVSSAVENTAGVKKAVVLKFNESLVAFVTPADVRAENVVRMVRAHLPYYCVPSQVLSMEDLPRTGNGKVDKRALLRGLSHTKSTLSGSKKEAKEVVDITNAINPLSVSAVSHLSRVLRGALWL
ncbi:AMP-binding enzyme [Gracilaria domingensis]|nr:AMP-binding enzyme [Gracilaria domingensis]